MASAALELLISAKDSASGVLDRIGGTVAGLGPLAAGAGLALGAGVAAGFGKAISLASAAQQGVNDFRAELGLTEEQAARLGDVGLDIYAANWGSSLEDVNEALGQTRSILGDMPPDALQEATQDAIAMRDVFGKEVPETIRLAQQLVTNGLAPNIAAANDMLTSGLQQGLDKSGDLFDTLSEYGDDFKRLGLTGDQAMAMINRGLEGGIYNTDKIGDSINEFGVNLRDPAVLTALSEVDKGVAGIVGQFQRGEISEGAAFEGIINGLEGMKDPIAQDTAGVLLFRSMWEDAGAQAILSLGGINEAVETSAGATDTLAAKYENLPSLIGGAWRMVQTGVLLPLGDKLLDLANTAMPLVQRGIEALGSGIESVSNIVTLLTTGNFEGGIFGLSEDHPAISALLTLREEAIGLFEALQTGDFSVITGKFAELGEKAGAWIADALPGVLENLQGYRQVLFEWVSENLPGWLESLADFGARAGQWVLDAIPGLLANLGTFAQSGINALMEHLPGWIATLAEYGIKAVSWIADKLPDLANNLGAFLNWMINWVVDSLPTWGAQLAELGAKIAGWVLDALPGLAANLGEATGKLLGWIVETVIEVTPKLIELGGKFFGWVADTVIPALPGALATIGGAIWTFLTNIANEVGPKIAPLAQKFYTWVQDEVIPKLPGVMEAIKTTIGGWITGAASWAGGALKSIGASIVQSLIDGLASMFESVKRKLGELTDLLPDWKGPALRDAQLLYNNGVLTMQGFNQGLLDTIPMVERTLGHFTRDLELAPLDLAPMPYPGRARSRFDSPAAGAGSGELHFHFGAINISGYSKQDSESLLRRVVREELQQVGYTANNRSRVGG